MIFQKCCKNKGIIIVDILVALSLAVLFIAVITSTSIDSRMMFERAKEHNLLLKGYEVGSTTISGQLYGNDRVQIDIKTISTSSTDSDQLQFTQVFNRPLITSPNDGFTDLIEFAGTPLCSVDFRNSFQATTTSITSILLPINPSLPLTDLEVRNGIAYISADSGIASDPDLLIVDIHNVSNPIISSSINTGPGISSIALAGKRIYAATPSTAAQLHIIRLDGLSNPVLEKKFRLPLPNASSSPTLASTIFYSKNKVYLGTEKWDGDEFITIDVSNPIQTLKVGGLEIGSKVNDIITRDGLAYITSSNQLQLGIVDIGNQVSPIITNTFSPSGWSRQEGKVISIFEDSLNLGRTSGGYNVITDHEIFTWLANASTTLMNPISIDIPGGIYGVMADRYHIYLATRQINKEFQIFDHDLIASTSKVYSLPIAPQMMTCDRDRLYILAHNAPFIYEITFK